MRLWFGSVENLSLEEVFVDLGGTHRDPDEEK